jgi:hypothetical protein
MKILKIKGALVLLTICITVKSSGLGFAFNQDTTRVHELLLYTVPSFIKLDWSSPSSLLEKSIDSFILSRFSKKSYSIGHMIIVFNTPMADSSVKMAMRSTSNKEKIDLFIRDGVGLGILGAPMSGRLETPEEIDEYLSFYQKRERRRISFIRYILNDKSADRVLKFLSLYSGKENPEYRPYKLYGGEFWPRFKNEGAGCSAFAIATLDVAGIPVNNPEWYVSVNIPQNIVGGEYNKGRKVKGVDIEYSKRWHSGDGVANVDFFPYMVYDPSKLYDWIQNLLSNPVDQYKPYKIGRFKGVSYDARGIIPDDEPIIIERKEPSVFVNKNIIVPLRP